MFCTCKTWGPNTWGHSTHAACSGRAYPQCLLCECWVSVSTPVEWGDKSLCLMGVSERPECVNWHGGALPGQSLFTAVLPLVPSSFKHKTPLFSMAHSVHDLLYKVRDRRTLFSAFPGKSQKMKKSYHPIFYFFRCGGAVAVKAKSHAASPLSSWGATSTSVVPAVGHALQWGTTFLSTAAMWPGMTANVGQLT